MDAWIKDKLSVIFVCLLGFGGLFFYFQIFNGQTTDAILTSSTVMVLFSALVWYRHSKLKIDSEAQIDQVYYMGFIFTIAALIASFYPYLSNTASDKQLNQDLILGNFGLGLISTLIGLSLRIVLNALLLSDKSLVDELGDLTEAVNKLKIDISGLSTRLNATSEEIGSLNVDQLKNVLHDAGKEIASTSAQMLESTKQTADKIITEAAQQLATTTSALSKQITQQSETIAQASQKTANEFTEVAKALADQRGQLQEALVALVGALKTGHGGLSKGLTAMQDTVGAFSLVGLESALSTAGNELKDASKRMASEMASATQTVVHGILTNVSGLVVGQAQSFVDQNQNISKANAQLATEIANAIKAIATNVETASKQFDILKPTLELLNNSLKSHEQLLEKLQSIEALDFNATKEQLAELTAKAAKLSERFHAVREGLVIFIEGLIEAVNKKPATT